VHENQFVGQSTRNLHKSYLNMACTTEHADLEDMENAADLPDVPGRDTSCGVVQLQPRAASRKVASQLEVNEISAVTCLGSASWAQRRNHKYPFPRLKLRHKRVCLELVVCSSARGAAVTM
jgi:hypothetical protein